MLEVGCAPAKWLIFYAEHFGARVSGIEYSDKGARMSRDNLAAAGVEGEIDEGDFFAATPRPYDLVASIGFIEHFDDIEAAAREQDASVEQRVVGFQGPYGRSPPPQR